MKTMFIKKAVAMTAALLFAAVCCFGGGNIVYAANPAAEVTLEDGTVKSFTDFRKAWDYADENMDSTIKMQSDWNLDGDTLVAGTWLLTPSRFTLDLNGFTIDGGGDTIISIKSSFLSSYGTVTELTIIDSSAAKTGVMKNGGSIYYGGIVNKGILHFNGGTLRDCVSDKDNGNGAGIYVANEVRKPLVSLYPAGTLIMDGGRIENCTGAAVGGGVYVGERSTVHLVSGAIVGCSCDSNGGGVFVDHRSSLTMEDGFTISGCSSTVTGGGVAVRASSTFTMNGGIIERCSSVDGGGVYCCPSGADVSGTFLSAATVNLLGGTIRNNTCTGSGAGVGTYGAFLGSPAFLTLGGDITIVDNIKDGKQNNLFLDSATFDDDNVYFSVASGYLSGTVGITCKEKRRISNADSYHSNRSALRADDPNLAIVYGTADQCYYLGDSKQMPELISAELAYMPVGAWTDYDYVNHIATVNIPRKVDIAETVTLEWVGEKAYIDDGSWKGTYTESPTGIKFFNYAGVVLDEQKVTFSNSNGDSVTWIIRIRGVEKETLYICNGRVEGYEPTRIDPDTGYRFYEFYPGTPLCISPDEPESGMVFDRWRTSSGSGVYLEDEQAYSEKLVIDMPSALNNRFGLKASFKQAPAALGVSGPASDNRDDDSAALSQMSGLASSAIASADETSAPSENPYRAAILALCVLAGLVAGAVVMYLIMRWSAARKNRKQADEPQHTEEKS